MALIIYSIILLKCRAGDLKTDGTKVTWHQLVHFTFNLHTLPTAYLYGSIASCNLLNFMFALRFSVKFCIHFLFHLLHRLNDLHNSQKVSRYVTS